MPETLLARSVDILRWLEADADTGFDQRLSRDREIGRQLMAEEDLPRVLGWWQKVKNDQSVERSTGARVDALSRVAVVLLGLLGLFVGAGLGSVAFAYDGSHPVNVLALLGVLVGLPFLLLLLTLVYLLPGRVPGFGAFREAIAVVNPGRWAGAWLDRYAGLDLYAGFGRTGGSFARWQLTVFSQWFAVGYFLGVLIAGLVLVAVTDLAFGWSSTLDLDSETVHGLFALLSWPWQNWLAGAVPDAELVTASRYYRLETVPVGAGEAAELGNWWPFVLMTILFWGLLPRVLLLGLGHWRRSSALRSMLCQNPEVLALLDRLRPPRVDFGPGVKETDLPRATGAAAPPELRRDERMGVLIWNDAVDETRAREWLSDRLGTPGGPVLSLGIRDINGMTSGAFELPAGADRLALFTKGWEPPLLEFADFLKALRALAGEAVTFVVVPINTRRDGIDASDREIWAEFLGRQSDRRLYVMQPDAVAQSQEPQGSSEEARS